MTIGSRCSATCAITNPPATAVALEVLCSPRTTFGRPVHLRQAERELAHLFAQGLIYRIGDGRPAAFALTIAGRQLLRVADVV